MSGMILETESPMAQQRTDQQRRVKLIKWEESTGGPVPIHPPRNVRIWGRGGICERTSDVTQRGAGACTTPGTATSAISGNVAWDSCLTSQQQDLVPAQQQVLTGEEEIETSRGLVFGEQPSCKRAWTVPRGPKKRSTLRKIGKRLCESKRFKRISFPRYCVKHTLLNIIPHWLFVKVHPKRIEGRCGQEGSRFLNKQTADTGHMLLNSSVLAMDAGARSR